MNDLEAIKWIMAQPKITLDKCGSIVTLITPEYGVSNDTMIKCVIDMKMLLEKK
jgi:hypothetical protein